MSADEQSSDNESNSSKEEREIESKNGDAEEETVTFKDLVSNKLYT